MTDITCRDLYERANAFVDGTLDPAEWPALRKHLAECDPCLAYLDQLGTTIELLRSLPGATGHGARAELLRRFEAWATPRRA